MTHRLIRSTELLSDRFATESAGLRLPALEILGTLRALPLARAVSLLGRYGLATTLAQLGQALLRSEREGGSRELWQTLAKLCLKLRTTHGNAGLALRYHRFLGALHTEVGRREALPRGDLTRMWALQSPDVWEAPATSRSPFLQGLFDACERSAEGEFWNELDFSDSELSDSEPMLGVAS